ncbi:MAG: 50S ribosomal protein L17 [Candidatus Nealsonbacteria bacterium]|nr:MAG: 50S ribosomal protein L17 [Candidatus Nealsonbacteria bacterium]
MKKRKKGRKLSRKRNQRRALLRSLAREFFLKEKIKTTKAKAKELSIFAEKQITKAKKADLSARRLLAKNFSSQMVKKIVEEIAPRYKERKGGYTRIIKLGPRKSNGAKMAIIELVE